MREEVSCCCDKGLWDGDWSFGGWRIDKWGKRVLRKGGDIGEKRVLEGKMESLGRRGRLQVQHISVESTPSTIVQVIPKHEARLHA